MPIPALPPGPPACIAPYRIASGLNLDDNAGTEAEGSSRTGHAAFTQAELKREVAKLDGPQREDYRAVRAVLAPYPATQAQWDALVVKHRLKYRDIHGDSVLVNLDRLATAPMVSGIDRGALTRDLVEDLCRPSTIDQAAHGTCTATSIQAALARRNPGEYARFVVGLGTGSGAVASRDGRARLTASLYLPYQDRSVSSNLMQPAIMELEAQVEGGHYNNHTDKITPAHGAPHGGAYDADVAAVATALMGRRYAVLEVRPGARDQVLALLRHASPKYPLIVGVSTSGGGGHEMQVVGYEAAGARVVFRNPWGLVQKVPFTDFLKAADGVVYDTTNHG